MENEELEIRLVNIEKTNQEYQNQFFKISEEKKTLEKQLDFMKNENYNQELKLQQTNELLKKSIDKENSHNMAVACIKAEYGMILSLTDKLFDQNSKYKDIVEVKGKELLEMKGKVGNYELDYYQKIKGTEWDIYELTMQLKQAKNKLDSEQKLKKELQSKNQDLHQRLRDSYMNQLNMETELECLKKEKKSLIENYENCNSKLFDLQLKVKELKSDLTFKEDFIKELKSKIRVINSEKDYKIGEIIDVSTQNSFSYFEIKKEHEFLNEEFMNFRLNSDNKIRELESENENLREKLESYNKEKEELEHAALNMDFNIMSNETMNLIKRAYVEQAYNLKNQEIVHRRLEKIFQDMNKEIKEKINEYNGFCKEYQELKNFHDSLMTELKISKEEGNDFKGIYEKTIRENEDLKVKLKILAFQTNFLIFEYTKVCNELQKMDPCHCAMTIEEIISQKMDNVNDDSKLVIIGEIDQLRETNNILISKLFKKRNINLNWLDYQ